MTVRRLSVALMPIVFAACSSGRIASAPQVPAISPAAAQALANTQVDTAELRRDLEQAYEIILARASGQTKAEVVDADAGLSMEIPSHRTIDSAVDLFANRMHDSIQASLYRSARYKELIDEVLDEYGLPRGLAYLPVIESAYIPTLTSKAGAHGIWQFMPETAREYGMRIDWWIDHRADPVRSTRAAARYLRYLYDQFQDWPLALAAYNCGPGRVRRLLDSSGATSFWELQERALLPKETRGYVPTFFATLIIVSDPAAYGFELIEPQPLTGKEVTIEGPVSLDYLAQLTGTPKEELRLLNPTLRNGVVPPEPTRLLLPEEVAPVVEARAETLKFEDPDVRVTSFTLRPGDSIAALAKRLKLTPEQIAAMNRGRGSARTGESVYLPVTKSDLSTLLRKSPAGRYHTVKKGDTLYSIAKKHGLTVEELVDLNRMDDDDKLKIGQRLRVTLGTTVTGGM